MAKLGEFSPVNPHSYYDWSREENTRKINEISKAIQTVDLPEGTYIATTGSDGRKENPAISHTLGANDRIGSDDIQSNPEFIVIHTDDIERQKVADEIERQIQEKTRYIMDDIEFRKINDDSMIFYRNDSNLIFPTRIWDMHTVAGDSNLRTRSLQQSIQEIQLNRKAIERLQDRLIYHRKITRNGGANFHGEYQQAIDYSAGKVNFIPKHNPSIKSGPLRVVQYSLALGVMKSIANTHFSLPHLENLPTNIHTRLVYLEGEQLTHLSLKEIEELQYIYSYFLQLYHKILALYGIGGITEFELAPNTIQEVSEYKDELLSDKFRHTRLIRV